MPKSQFRIEVRSWKVLAVSSSELVSLTDAAERMGLSSSAMGDLVYRGVLRRVEDMGEPNPRRRTRVFRVDVEAEIVRRGTRRRDGRVRGRVK